MSSFSPWSVNTLSNAGPNAQAQEGPYRPSQWSKPQLVSLSVVIPQLSNSSDDSSDSSSSSSGTPTVFYFDAVMRVTHDQTLKITEHPVQNGAPLVDHAYMIPARVSLSIFMSDVVDSYQSGQYSGGSSKSVTAYQTMKYIQSLRQPITLNTRLDQYSNMLIENIRADESVETIAGARFTMSLRQVLMANVSITPVSNRPQQTDSTNQGTLTPQPVPPDLSSVFNATQPGTSEFSVPQWNSNPAQ